MKKNLYLVKWYQALVILLLVLYQTTMIKARLKRCFTCRSRTNLGDCKDPFLHNSTNLTEELSPQITATPCASGWCGKIIEDDFGDTITATERMCMPRPPTDNEERCSETVYEHNKGRKVFLCMCFGDLCNASASLLIQSSSVYLIVPICTLYLSAIFSHLVVL